MKPIKIKLEVKTKQVHNEKPKKDTKEWLDG